MSTTKPTTANSNPCLSQEVALTLISEKVRFWSDNQQALDGSELPARCLNPNRLYELQQSLIEIDDHCKSAIRAGRKTRGEG